MPAPPPPAPGPTAVVARDPFGLGDAPAPAPRSGIEHHLDLDWGEPDAGAAPRAAATPPPPAEILPVANAPVVALEELDFEPVDEPGAGSTVEAIELPDVGSDEELELAPATDFIPPAETTGHAAASDGSPAVELDIDLLAPEAAASPAPAPPPASVPAPAHDGGEAQLRQALSQASREVIERIAWEVVPQLAETIIREQLERLVKERQR
jgi:hypothetical protein